MARFTYDKISEYIKVAFECPHCHKIIEHIFDVPKDEDCIHHSFKCRECTATFETETTIDVYTIEIKGLNQTSIKGFWPINYENYLNEETELIDSAAEIRTIKEMVCKTNGLDKSIRNYLYSLLWCRVISILDNYAHKAIERRIFRYETYKERYILLYLTKKNVEDITDGDLEQSLKHQSFYQVDTTLKILHNIFMINIPTDTVLRDAATLRNQLIHHLNRGKDGEDLSVSKDKLLDLMDRVMHFITIMQQKMWCLDAEIVMNNFSS